MFSSHPHRRATLAGMTPLGHARTNRYFVSSIFFKLSKPP
jgi:hypothetical protein